MTTKLRWGIMGTGAIARKFASGLLDSLTGELVAVGSRAEGTLGAFLADFPARGHATYEALLADPEVEAVYISTPHPSHAEWAIKTARAGKHILCEKPLTMNATEAEAVIAAAREADVFLMEAFMYRCHPQTARLMELLKSGTIGRVRLVQAAFSFRTEWNPEGRLLSRELGGGGILDIGCYCVSMSRLIAGITQGRDFAEPEEVRALADIGETGVDEFASAVMKFPGGMIAQLACGVRLNMDNALRVWGDEGTIVVPGPWVTNRTKGGESSIFVHREGSHTEEIKIVAERNAYAMEADVAAEWIGSRQAPVMSWDDTLGNMRALDWWRAEIGLDYGISGERRGG